MSSEFAEPKLEQPSNPTPANEDIPQEPEAPQGEQKLEEVGVCKEDG